ncbi:MAG TPA: ABC transporter permease [Chloroflexota bacterium]|nr:ABC transporter permease [Chloroflexota bacterium]
MPGRRRRRRLGREPVIAIALIGVILLGALLAPLIAPFDPLAQDLARRLEPPGARYLMGSDSLGRDVFSRLLFGARTSLLVGVLAVAAASVLGSLAGITAGYFGGWWDGLMMRIVDIWQAVPYLILALAIAVVLGPGLETLIVVLALGTWMTFARVLRGETLTLRASNMVLAAQVVGASHRRVLLSHILPQLSGSLAVLSSLMVGSTILFEASLSFLGLGIQRPMPSWGNMLLDGVDVLDTAWWVTVFPGLAVLLASLAVNLLGDWLRDAFDPRR